MKKVIIFLFSSRLMAILLAIFALSIAVATFIERDYGTATARAAVYHSLWFQIMLFLGIVNLTGTIFIKRLYRPEKLSIFTFHLAFLVILLGSAITHYIGFNGVMHIREGEASNIILSDDVYFSAKMRVGNVLTETERPIYFSAFSRSYPELQLTAANKTAMVECLEYIPHAKSSIADDPEGRPMIELVWSAGGGRQSLILTSGESDNIGSLSLSLNDSANPSVVKIWYTKEGLLFTTAVPAKVMNMATQVQENIQVNKVFPFQLATLYSFGDIQIVAKTFNPSAKLEIANEELSMGEEGLNALRLRVSCGGEQKTILYFASPNTINKPVEVSLNGASVSVSVGSKLVQIPFALKLNKFTLERYPGSMSPSWFESKIIIQDSKENDNSEHRIFMNNVLKYKGFRFYQSSYDTDEHGTILSVNQDYWGTLVTYLGYLMLAFGIVFSLINKNSRFRKISAELSRLREVRKAGRMVALIIIFSLICSIYSMAQSSIPDSVFIDKQHASEFAALLIQDPGGRIKPINTLSSELLRKVSRKDRVLGQTSDQVLLGMMAYPRYWQQVPMIKISHPEVQKILHVQNPMVAFVDFFNHTSVQKQYLLESYVKDAYQKKPASRDKFDNELIKIDERLNLCYMVYTGELLRIFPKPNDEKKAWFTPLDIGPEYRGQDSLIVTSIIPLYFRSIREASATKNWKTANETLALVRQYQSKFGTDLIPASSKIKVEILYNKLNLFDRIAGIYGIVGFILLILQFLSVFLPRLNLKPIILGATIVILLTFLFHLSGLILRWYISGHAPWTNAYESLVYIAFATMAAGIIFSRKSGIALSATALLAWLILFVAHLNWIDPEITNLVPVLKSYWLLIHVAIITASYGFLALGALLAFINLIVMILQTAKNLKVSQGIILELSIIIEMTLIVGLYMLTIGTFLGGVWANESWGRYWGWDPKETWALVSVLVYAFIAHMRMVPGLKGNYTFNLAALLGFSSIVMTYFGVNYYLAGLHSYAKGDPLPIPSFVYYSLAVIIFTATLAFVNQHRLKTTSE
jgi:cytochrome c-type biogenesis protein CcsB